MSKEDFRQAYENSDIKKLKKYVDGPKVLSTKELIKNLAECLAKPKLFNVILQILFAQDNLNKIVSHIIKIDHIDLLDRVLSYDDSLELDEKLILKTLPRGRVTMAKMIYEYIHGSGDDLKIVCRLLKKYTFVYNPEENTIDSFVLALYLRENNDAIIALNHIGPNFWNDWAIRACGVWSNVEIAKRLLGHPMVDPGVDNNFCLKQAFKRGDYHMANELLKHPLVAVKGINLEFVCFVINHNCVCVAERMLRSGDNFIVSFFKERPAINSMISSCNDVTCLAIKLGIINLGEVLEVKLNKEKAIKNHLKNVKLDDPYVMKSYEDNLDPLQIYQIALESDDMDLAKSIKSYPISISPHFLFSCLYGREDCEIYNYIWNTKIKEYDPIYFFGAGPIWRLGLSDSEMDKLFNIFKDDPRFDYESICGSYQFKLCKSIMRELVKRNCNKKEYKAFCKKYGEDDQ
jgi:hypothetical protein